MEKGNQQSQAQMSERNQEQKKGSGNKLSHKPETKQAERKLSPGDAAGSQGYICTALSAHNLIQNNQDGSARSTGSHKNPKSTGKIMPDQKRKEVAHKPASEGSTDMHNQG